MDADQHQHANPFGMDEACERCPDLCVARERVVHGYGDVAADFLFVGERPSAGARAAGVPLAGPDARRFQDLLGRLGLNESLPHADAPRLTNAYLTLLTRCRHPDRPPADAEVRNCEAFLSSEVRMVNPEVIVPVGDRALREVLGEYATVDPDDYDAAEAHATEIRGRGFAIVPMVDLGDLDEDRAATFLDFFESLMARDYRQTKGRQGR